MKLFRAAVALAISLAWATSLAHGEDKPGPHGGHIRMPGAFHTELLVQNSHEVKIYLLDIDWKNPTTKNSSVEAIFAGTKPAKARCKAEKEFFLCRFDDRIDLKKVGELTINAIRAKQTGGPAVYQTPLKESHQRL